MLQTSSRTVKKGYKPVVAVRAVNNRLESSLITAMGNERFSQEYKLKTSERPVERSHMVWGMGPIRRVTVEGD
jgi:hypothetical protein